MAGHGIEDKFYAPHITIIDAAFAVTLHFCSKRCRLCRKSSRGQSEIREQYLLRPVDGHDPTNINMVSMNKLTFFNLCPIMSRKDLLRDTLHIIIE